MKSIFALTLCLLSSLSSISPVFAEDGLEKVAPAEVKEEKVEKKAEKRVFGKSDETSFAGKVVIIKVGEKDLSNGKAFKFWRRVLKRVNDENAKAVVFDLDTPGGLAFDTAELIMVDMQKIKVPSYAFVNQKALSAGALVASGTDEIYMHPVSFIGSAGIIKGDGSDIEGTMRAKIESAFDAFITTVAESKGRNPDVIRAMMFKDDFFNFGDIQVEQGKLLTLTASKAVKDFEGKPLLAKGIVNSIEELLEKEGLGDAEVIEAELSGMEQFAYWVAGFSGVILLIGMGGAYMEMKTPGFGIGGGISLLAFGLFFFGNYAAGNMAGYGLMLLFIIGVVLVIVELAVLPGMIVPGVIGAILILGSLLMAMVDDFAFDDNAVRGWDSANAWDFINGPAWNLAIGLIGSTILMILMMRFLPNIPLFNRMVMSKSLVHGNATEAGTPSGGTGEHVGMQGVTTTDLRPSGKGDFSGQTLDVTAASGFITSGKQVAVVSEDGLRILVEEE